MKRFNPPSNWPTPPFGWEPPPDWQSDPQWGPAPPGHQFWIDVPEQGATEEQRGKAITITALILAGVALILCWVPIVNNAVFFLGLIAIVLAVIALVVTRQGPSMMKGMAIASLAVGALSIVGVLATQAIYSSMLDGISEAVSGTDTDEPGKTSASDPGSAGPVATPSPSPGAVAGSAGQPLALGAAAAVGKEYLVAVTAVKLDANAEVAAANQFNDPPSGQFVLVQLSVTYVGMEEGTPWIDLSETFVGTDARQYDASACGAVVDQGAMEVPTLENSGTASYQLCMDVPAAAIEGGKIFVENSMSFRDKSRIYWAIR
jgi:hypothetical protein